MRDEKEYFPVAIEIETNTSCNRRCAHCPNSIFDRGLLENEQLMPTELFHKIIDELSEIEYNGLISPVFYGEPLLDKRIAEFLRYIRKKLPRSKILMYTNGDLLTYRKYLELIDAGVNEFLVTQHGEEMPAGIQELYSHQLSILEHPISIRYQVFTPNTEKYNRGGLVQLPVVNPVPGCAYEWIIRIVINYRGDVVICNNDYFASATFGNLQNDRLMDVWMDSEFHNIRDQVRNQEYTLPICKKCTEHYDPEKTRKSIRTAKIESLEIYEEDSENPINLSALSELHETTDFNVESIEVHEKKYLLKELSGIKHGNDKILVIKGWAIDSTQDSPAGGVFITIDSGNTYRCYYSLERPDVADAFNNKSLKETGFLCPIPLDSLPEWGCSFRIKIVSKDLSGVYYPEKKYYIDVVH